MHTLTLQTQTTFVVLECYSCGVPFGITEQVYRRTKDQGDTFYCPNGHSQVFSKTKDQEIADLKKKLKQTEDDKTWWRTAANERTEELFQTRKQLSTTRGQLTKTKNRISKGICPCCNRQFVNLTRHMHTQHPEYNAEESS